MAVTIKVKRGLEANLASADLVQGEMAFATDTGNVFINKAVGVDGDVVMIGTAEVGTTTPTVITETTGKFFYNSTSEDLYINNGTAYAPIGGGIQWERITATTTAEDGKGYIIDAPSVAVNLALPSGTEGDVIGVVVTDNTAGVTIGDSEDVIQGYAGPMTVDIADASFSLIYSDSTDGWRIMSKLQESITPVIVDLIANIPTGSYISGRLFYATDENKLYVDNGTTWKDLFLVDTTTGGNVAGAISVTTNGIGVKIDNDTIKENGSNQLYIVVDGGAL